LIYTVTLNPAIDQTLVLDRFVAGDTLRVKSSRFDPGGKGINVSRVIHELGGETVATGFTMGGLGRYMEGTLKDSGVECDFVHSKGEMRTNITILDESRHENTILSDRGPETSPKYIDQLMKKLEKRLKAQDWLVIAGSIPPPLGPEVYSDLITMARERWVHTVLDADGDALAAGVAAKPEIVKGNRRELERFLGRHLDDEASTLEAALMLREMSVRTAVITRGKAGAVAASDEGMWRGVAPRVRAVSAVGSGDAFLAGVVLTLSQGGALPQAIRLGVAAGTAVVLTPGTELCHRREVDLLLSRVKVQPIERRRVGGKALARGA
jgi:1-phosphofructokinase family hexose kinase